MNVIVALALFYAAYWCAKEQDAWFFGGLLAVLAFGALGVDVLA